MANEETREWVKDHDLHLWHWFPNNSNDPLCKGSAACGHSQIPGSPIVAAKPPEYYSDKVGRSCKNCRVKWEKKRKNYIDPNPEAMNTVNYLHPEFVPKTELDLINVLRCYLELYSKKERWLFEEEGERPHYLRKGMRLNYNPHTIEDGYIFAQEALRKLEKFYKDNPRYTTHFGPSKPISVSCEYSPELKDLIEEYEGDVVRAMKLLEFNIAPKVVVTEKEKQYLYQINTSDIQL